MAGFGLQSLLLVWLLSEPVATIRSDRETSLAAPLMADGTSALTPLQFLFISSPAHKKVLWTTVQNMKSTDPDGNVETLIADGLTEPKGLAFDPKHGFLYIADSGAQSIFRYTVIIKKDSASTSVSGVTLDTTHLRIPVVKNCGPVEWVTVDAAGNLFYSSPKSNNINKISLEVMLKLASGQMAADDLTIISEKTIELVQTARSAIALTSKGDVNPTDAPAVQAHIYSIYEAELNPNVSQPAAIWADGNDLYWTNKQDGTKAGTVVKGLVNPIVDKSSANKSKTAFPALPLTTKFTGGLGIAKSETNLFFIRNDTGDTLVLSALRLGTDVTIDLQKTMRAPRALVWDGLGPGGTVYVSDEMQGEVFSFPAGRLMGNVPLTKAANVTGPFGLAIMRSEDPCFTANTVLTGGGVSASMSNFVDENEQGEQAADEAIAKMSQSHRPFGCGFILMMLVSSLAMA